MAATLLAAVAPTLAAQEVSSRIVADSLPALLAIDAVPLGLPAERVVPKDNALTDARVALGRRLFFDPRLSADGSLSCASCHAPAAGLTTRDARARGFGDRVGRRNAPALFNRVYGRSQFWDGRAATLEEQALQPLESPDELATTVAAVVRRLGAEPSYVAEFQSAYGEPITSQTVARAIACFERALLSGNSPVDRFHAGDARSLDDRARQGLWLFESRAQCWKCHSGPNHTDESFHNTGVSWGAQPLDLGRFEVTGEERDRGRFKTPTLREVARTGPYMHDGSLGTLREVVEFYNRGGGRNPNLDPLMRPLELTAEEIEQLVAFLEALTGEHPR